MEDARSVPPHITNVMSGARPDINDNANGIGIACFPPEATPPTIEVWRGVFYVDVDVRLGPTASPPHQLVKDAIVTTLNKQEFLATSTRARAVQMHGKRLLSLANNNVTFSGFCEDLVKSFRRDVSANRKVQIQCCQTRTFVDGVSVEKLPSMWKKLYTTTLMHTDESEQLFDQTVNVVVYEQLLKQYFLVEAQENSEHQEMELSKDDYAMLVDM